VARAGRKALGWSALTPVPGRCVYVAGRARGGGIGLALMSALVSASEREGLWTQQAGIFPENAASIELHKRAGSAAWTAVGATWS
jgi:L-amino acid N-acyltransferase YncA